VKKQLRCRLATEGLSAAGVWVRRQAPMPSLTDEALCLAEVMHAWNLRRLFSLELVHGVLAEVSRPGTAPSWLYLLELVGRKLRQVPLISNHPLSWVRLDEPVRLVALLDPGTRQVMGALVESGGNRRLLEARSPVK